MLNLFLMYFLLLKFSLTRASNYLWRGIIIGGHRAGLDRLQRGHLKNGSVPLPLSRISASSLELFGLLLISCSNFVVSKSI